MLRRVTGSSAHAWGPAAILASLVALAFVVHHGYLTTNALNSNDWGWYSQGAARALAPWPALWDPSAGFGGNTLATRNFLPLHSLIGVLATLGLPWGIVEKITYFGPFAVLSFVGPYVLAHRVLRSRALAAAAAVLYASNTYLLVVAQQGQMTIAVAECLAPLVLWAHLRGSGGALGRARGSAIAWSLATALLLAIQTAFDLRIAYLTALCLAVELTLRAVATRSIPGLRRVLVTGAVTFGVYSSTQLYWIVPALAYAGPRDLPFGTDLFVPYTTLAHAMSALHPFWTGSTPSYFQTAPVGAAALLLPILAFAVLARRRLSYELLWLSLCGLAAVFLLKQDRPPLGGLYVWMFEHVPGWSLFRESSKLFWIIALVLALLLPEAARGAAASIRSAPHHVKRWRKTVGVGSAALVLAAVTAVAWIDGAGNLVPFAHGALAGTTRPFPEPASFSQLSTTLASDPRSSAVAWLGGAYVTQGDDVHHTPIGSARHPLVELDGQPPSDAVTGRAKDVLTRFCPSVATPFCYVRPGLFGYLAREVGLGYVVAPAGHSVGLLPAGLSRDDLMSDVTQALAASPEIVGRGDAAVAVWRVPDAVGLASSAPYAVSVGGAPEDTARVLPLLQALRAPVAYAADEAGLGASAPVVGVLPITSNHVAVDRTHDYAVLVDETSAAIMVDGVTVPDPSVLAVLGQSARLVGPVRLVAGRHLITGSHDGAPVTGGAQPQALVAWTPLAAAALRSPSTQWPVAVTPLRDAVSLGDSPGSIVLSRSTYDPQWTLAGATRHVIGDGLFNLFLVPARHPSHVLMTFTAARSAAVGLALAAGSTVLAVCALVVLGIPGRTRTKAASPSRALAGTESSNAAAIARIGLFLLVCAEAEVIVGSYGLPSILPQFFASGPAAPFGNSYGLAVDFYVALAVGALMLSLLVRVAMSWMPGRWPPRQGRTEQGPNP